MTDIQQLETAKCPTCKGIKIVRGGPAPHDQFERPCSNCQKTGLLMPGLTKPCTSPTCRGGRERLIGVCCICYGTGRVSVGKERQLWVLLEWLEGHDLYWEICSPIGEKPFIIVGDNECVYVDTLHPKRLLVALAAAIKEASEWDFDKHQELEREVQDVEKEEDT